ncbi:MAG: ankyrin repeat domain-containing protein [Wolbachia pipientis]
MPNEERPQDFELIELLIREAGSNVASTSTQQGSDFESFKARFQSYVDQVPSYLHSVGKEGFFPHFFLGSFSTLINTEIAKKLKIKKIYFRFDTPGTLKVAVISNDKIQSYADVKKYVKLISISEHHSNDQNCKFTSGDLVEILKKCLTLPKGQSIQAEAQGIKDAFKGPIDSVLEIDFRLIQISRNNINKEGINVEVIDEKVLNSVISRGFHEVKGGLWSNPESDIAKLTNSDAEKVKEPVENILKKVSEIHSGYENSHVYANPVLVYANQAREAAHHGFIAGALVNFRYRYNFRVYLEQFAGRGYADIVLVPRGKDRSLNAVPIIIELKAGTAAGTTPGSALEQAKGYAKGFQPNTMRVLTISDNVLCVGLNLDSTEKFSMHISPPDDRKPEQPTVQKLLEVTSSWNGEESTKDGLKKEIKRPLERIYHTFPGTPEKGGNYFSRFLLGQLLLADEFKRADLKKFIFLYGEYSLASTTRSGKPVTTFALIKEGRSKEVFIFHIREGGRGDRSSKKIPIPDDLSEQSKITEVYVSLQEGKKSDFFNIEEVNRYNSLNEYKEGKELFKGELKNVPYPNGLRGVFDEALKSQVTPAAGQSLSVDKYNSLLKKVGEGMFSFRDFINEEAHFQGVLHGAFSYYSDLKLQESPKALILTEFQTGRGKRIDMVVHGIKFADQASSAKEYDPVGLELKGPREGKTANALKDEANKQISDEYTKGVTYKTLTDGKEVAFMGVVFDKGASNADSLILMSKDEFASVKVVHSSIFSIGQQKCSKRRKQRSTGMACIDSRDEEKITEEEKEQRIKELFSADKVVEKVKNIEFYDQLFKVSQKVSKGEIIDKNVEEAFVAKIKDIDLDSIDPEIRDIVKEMKDNIENKEEVRNILRRSGVAEKIGKVAEGAGLAFTAFLVGKHIANGDIEGLGYDALNLWVMPKIGEKISGKILELGTKLDSQMLKGFAPAMGRAIGNFAAFLGLAESIKARQNATDPADIKIADLNIATHSIFIAADVPAVITETMSVAGLETGVVGEFAGPVGAAVSVAVIVISQFVEAGLEVEKLEEQMNLTDQEKHDLYWDLFLGKKVPDYIGNDLQAEEIYKQYISKILNQFKSNYDTIAISLPSILVTKEEYATSKHFRDKRQGHMMPSDVGKGIVEFLGGFKCSTQTRVISNRLGFDLGTNITHFLYADDMNYYSRIVPSTIENYSVTCGPRDDDITIHEKNREILYTLPSQASCGDSSPHRGRMLNRVLEKWSLQEHSGDCYNAVIYRNKNSRGYGSIYYIPAQNANVNIVFQEKDILNGDRDRRDNIENRYYFEKSLDSCKVYSPGKNFFHIAGKFSCDLGADGQKNIVITQGNLTTDSINIHSIIGSNRTNYLEFFNVDYVDGKGGNDVITAKNFTTIKGYFGDSIHGKGLVLLPINFNDIDNITHVNNITIIYNKSGAFISVDKQTSVKTADGLFVTPTKIDDKTGIVTNLHVTKSLSGDIVLDDELDNLRKIENSNFNITKQLSSANYHSTIGSSSNHIFYPDKEHHNFYWEAPSNISHLYLFDNRNANITIAQANGILDFSQLNSTLNDMPFIENDKGEIKINKNGLNVTLLPDYKDVTVTFDGEEYYKLQNGELERGYCSHSLRIDGRFSVNGTDLLNHHNCFTFDSDKVLFLKLNNDLLLLSDRGALSISDYYSSVHKNWDLSIGLNNRIMEPEEFGERADEFSSFRYYQPDEQGLQIYHNQPINKNDIGLVDLKGKSILDFDIKVMNDTLLLSHKNNTLVKLENWNTYQPAREMMFGFNDATVSNSKCIVSTCNSEDVIVEFNKEKIILQISNAIKQNNINAKDKDGKTLFHIVVNKGDLSYAKLLIGKIESMNFEDNLYSEPDELVKAVRQRERLKSLINEKDKFGYTPLQYSAKNGKWDIVNLFLDKTAERNQDDVADKNKFSTSWTTMHYAVYNGNMDLLNDIFQFLSDKETIINTKDNSDWTPLHYAVYYNALDVVKFLVGKGADISARDKDGKIPLDLATQENGTGIAEFLKQTQLDLDKQLLTAVQDRNLSKAEVLVSRGANINTKNDDGYTSLHFAVLKNFQSGIDYLIKKGANIDAKDNIGRTPLHWAARDGYLGIVQAITEGGANLDVKDKDNKTPSDLASWKGYNNIVQYLKQVQLDKKLLAAAKGNDCHKVKNLVSQGASLEAKDRNGRTSLYWASCNGYLGVVQCLIDRGANLETRDNNGNTPLHCAAWSGQFDIVKSLVDSRRVGVNIKNDDGWTPLHWASRAGYLDVVGYLVNNRASVDARDKDGTTPLGIARAVERSNIVKYLEKRLNKKEEKSVQRKRRHHHGDHDYHRSHLSRNLLAIDSSNQPEITASSGTRPSSWINNLFGWVKSSVGGLLNSKPTLPEETSSTSSPISKVDAPLDINGTIMLLDVLVRKFTGKKYVSEVDQSVPLLEARGYALNITKGFEKVVEQAGLKSGVSMHRLNIDYMGMQKEIIRKVIRGQFNEISGILSSYLEKACPGREAGYPGKLSPKKFDKFMLEFNKGLLNQSIKQILHNGDGTLEVDDAKQMNLEPQSYLSNASVQGHLTQNKVKLIS